MSKRITNCPICNTKLVTASLQCPACKLELRGEFEMSVFDRLDDEQNTFLMTFLKNQGNLSAVQSEMQLSYPAAKKKLHDVLSTIGLESDNGESEDTEGELNMEKWAVDESSTKASDIVRAKLKACGGRAIVHTERGLAREIVASRDGQSFICDQLPLKPPYRFEVFDVIVDLLQANHGKARKGNGRNYKLGDPECDETTVVGAIGYFYAGKKTGDSVFDPVFILAAVLEWAGIVYNERGWLILR